MEDLINQLPDDCLEHIFSFLPIKERLNVERVCKRWHNIGEKGWPDIKKIDFPKWMSDNLIHSILKRCGRFLRNLEISRSSNHLHCLSMIIQFCKLEQLESIAIHHGFLCTERQRKLEMDNLMEIFGKAKNLVNISIDDDLEAFPIDYLNLVDPTAVRKLEIENNGKRASFNPDRFPNLKKLTLSRIRIDEYEMPRDNESLKGLEEITIKYCLISRSFIERIQSFTNLQELNLTYNLCDIRNNDICQIASHCDEMKKVYLTGTSTSNLTSTCFQYLGKMPKLMILDLRDFRNVNSRDMVHLTNVRKLFLDSCAGISMEDGLIQLITNSSNLDELTLGEIRDLGINFINNVQLIFHRGLRQEHLHMTAYIDYSDELFGRTSPIVIDEPLLSATVHIYEEDD